MSKLTDKLDGLKKKYERLTIKYPSQLKYSNTGNFTIRDDGELHKFFIRADNSYFTLTLVPSATTDIHLIQETCMEQFYSPESLFEFVIDFYKKKRIEIQYPNSMRFILDLDDGIENVA